jgi:hypothetical protein
MPRRTIDHLGLYFLPHDLRSAIQELDAILPQEAKIKLAKYRSTAWAHRGLGMWIRNNWGLWSQPRRRPTVNKHEKNGGCKESGLMRAKSPLREYFLRRGFSNPDEISGLILDAYQRHLRGVNRHPAPKPKIYWKGKPNEILAFLSHMAD